MDRRERVTRQAHTSELQKHSFSSAYRALPFQHAHTISVRGPSLHTPVSSPSIVLSSPSFHPSSLPILSQLIRITPHPFLSVPTCRSCLLQASKTRETAGSGEGGRGKGEFTQQWTPSILFVNGVHVLMFHFYHMDHRHPAPILTPSTLTPTHPPTLTATYSTLLVVQYWLPLLCPSFLQLLLSVGLG